MSFSHLWQFNYAESLAADAPKQDQNDNINTGNITFSDPRPVVVVFGWLGAQMKHMQKFVQLYNQRNCDVLVLICPTLSVWITTKAEQIAEFLLLKLFKFLTTHSKPNEFRPVFYHLFSGSPKTCFFQIMKILHRAESDKIPKGKESRYKVFKLIKRHTMGLIYDSCPVEFDSRIGVKNLSAGQGPLIRYFWEGTRLVLEFFFGRIWEADKKDFWIALNEKFIHAPHLFFYASNDDQAPYATIETYIDHLKSRGVEVFVKKWDESKHVQHFVKYREEYLTKTDFFINHCYNLFIQNNSLKKISATIEDPAVTRSKL
jgi:farnesol dehydrogenase